jgi:hypothetical protein
MKKHLHKLPFGFKLWWAKQLTHMFKGFGSTFTDDIVLYNELNLWIETKGKPTTSSVGYQEKKILDRILEIQGYIKESPDQDPRDAYDIRAWKDEIVTLELELDYLRKNKSNN